MTKFISNGILHVEINPMTKGWVFGPIDLKDVYFFVNIILNSSDFFRFKFDNTLYLFMGRGCGSVVEPLPKERKVFGSNPVSPVSRFGDVGSSVQISL